MFLNQTDPHGDATLTYVKEIATPDLYKIKEWFISQFAINVHSNIITSLIPAIRSCLNSRTYLDLGLGL